MRTPHSSMSFQLSVPWGQRLSSLRFHSPQDGKDRKRWIDNRGSSLAARCLHLRLMGGSCFFFFSCMCMWFDFGVIFLSVALQLVTKATRPISCGDQRSLITNPHAAQIQAPCGSHKEKTPPHPSGSRAHLPGNTECAPSGW